MRRVTAGCGLAFVALYLAHRLTQLAPPDGTAALAAVVAAHSGRLLVSEVLNGAGLVVFVGFLGGLHALLRTEHWSRATMLAGGTAFVALGFVSTAAETSLVHAAVGGDVVAVGVFDQLQARTPVVLAAAVFTAASAVAAHRAGVLGRGLAAAGGLLAVAFVAGGVLSVVGSSTDDSSIAGPAVFLAWVLVLVVACRRSG